MTTIERTVLVIFFNAIGLVLAWLIGRKIKVIPYEKMTSKQKTSIFLGIVAGVLIGGKLPIFLSYGWGLEWIITGKSFYGAIIGAYFGVNIAKRLSGVTAFLGDRFIVPLCIAAAIGGIGCFFNGCCGGILLPKTLNSSIFELIYTWPTQLLTTLFQAACAMVFWNLYIIKKWSGHHFVLYLIFYGVFRFLIEFIRIEPRFILNLTVYQWMSIVFVPWFVIELTRRIRVETLLRRSPT